MSTPTFTAEVAFASDPFDDPQVYTDVTEDLRSFEVSYGRRTRGDHPETGTGSVLLRNEDRRYDPENGAAVALTLSGSPTFNGDGSCTIDSTGNDRVQAPASLLDETQGWVAVLIEPTWASTALPNAAPIAFEWRNASAPANQLNLYRASATQWEADGIRNGTITTAKVAAAHDAGDPVTLIAAWTDTTVALSVDGGAFTTSARGGTVGGSALPALFEIGERNASSLHIEAAVFWFACGTGTLTDADAATIDAFGDRDPGANEFPDDADTTMVWAAINSDGSTGSPYAPNVLPMKRIRITADLDATPYSVFEHFVDPDHGWPQSWVAPSYTETEVRGVDGFAVLANIQLGEDDSWSEQLSGARVNAIFDAADVPAGERDVDDGQETLTAAAAGSLADADLLAQLHAALDTEAGLAFVAPAGTWTFHGRHARMAPPFSEVQATFADAENMQAGYLPFHGLLTAPSDIRNRWQITRDGGSELSLEDTASRDAFTLRVASLSTLHVDDDRVRSRLYWELGRSKEPRTLFEQLIIRPGRDSDLWAAVLSFAPGTRIRVIATPPGGGAPFDREVHIEGVRLRVPPGVVGAECEWRLSDAERLTYWLLGDSVLGVLGSTTRVAH